MKNKQHGFTIVELLIVIIVIGILAAIVIVAYRGVQDRASDAKRVADISSIAKAMSIWKVDDSHMFNVSGTGAGGTDRAGFRNQAVPIQARQ